MAWWWYLIVLVLGITAGTIDRKRAQRKRRSADRPPEPSGEGISYYNLPENVTVDLPIKYPKIIVSKYMPDGNAILIGGNGYLGDTLIVGPEVTDEEAKVMQQTILEAYGLKHTDIGLDPPQVASGKDIVPWPTLAQLNAHLENLEQYITQDIKITKKSAYGFWDTNPVLELGEIGIETDTYRVKQGDGKTVWCGLPYWPAPKPTVSINLVPAQPSLDVVRELEKLVPAVTAARVGCPVETCHEIYVYHPFTEPTPLCNVILHLNDSHKWTREAIADWLDTLKDIDLTLTATSTGD